MSKNKAFLLYENKFISITTSILFKVVTMKIILEGGINYAKKTWNFSYVTIILSYGD